MSFTTQGHLTDHKRRHSGERPYLCEICNDKFMRSSTLKIHMRRHTGEKPYKCDKCERAFSESGNLRTHLRTHVYLIIWHNNFRMMKACLLEKDPEKWTADFLHQWAPYQIKEPLRLLEKLLMHQKINWMMNHFLPFSLKLCLKYNLSFKVTTSIREEKKVLS